MYVSFYYSSATGPCPGPTSYNLRSTSLWEEVLFVTPSDCGPVQPCYFGIAVQPWGTDNATFSLLVNPASQPVYLVR